MDKIIQFINVNRFRAAFLIVVFLTTAWGAISTLSGVGHSLLTRQRIPFSFYGDTFAGLSDVEAIRNERYMGYFTDGDPEDPKVIAKYEQVQLMLVPVVLELNALEHRFVLFNCEDANTCLKKIAETKAKPLKVTQNGTILAMRSNF